MFQSFIDRITCTYSNASADKQTEDTFDVKSDTRRTSLAAKLKYRRYEVQQKLQLRDKPLRARTVNNNNRARIQVAAAAAEQ